MIWNSLIPNLWLSMMEILLDMLILMLSILKLISKAMVLPSIFHTSRNKSINKYISNQHKIRNPNLKNGQNILKM
jgi:hypothetical protein